MPENTPASADCQQIFAGEQWTAWEDPSTPYPRSLKCLYLPQPSYLQSPNFPKKRYTIAKARTVKMFGERAISLQLPVDVPFREAPRFRNALLQNTPNPFNPLTKMAYSLEAAGRVTIRVYDVSGSLVRTLMDVARPAGMYEAIWDGRNDAGEVVSSGVYVVKMNVSAYEAIRKAALLK